MFVQQGTSTYLLIHKASPEPPLHPLFMSVSHIIQDALQPFLPPEPALKGDCGLCDPAPDIKLTQCDVEAAHKPLSRLLKKKKKEEKPRGRYPTVLHRR